MKAEDKAKELFDKYVVYAKRPPKTENISKENWIYEITENAKKCALICVDEIIKEHFPQDVQRCEFWQEVKKEIEKL